MARKKGSKKVLKKLSAKKTRNMTGKAKLRKAIGLKATVSQKSQPLVLQNIRGMRDILPKDQSYWNHARRVLSRSASEYGFSRIDIPTVEYADIFTKAIGEGTDIIDKEMYVFTTKGGDKVALRPEFTAGVARAYIQHGMNVQPKPIKLFSTGPVYRYDRPQEGRYREHFQGNFDIFGEDDPVMDAHLIQLAHRIMFGLGIKNIQFQLNSIGCPQCRKDYRNLLVSYFESSKQKLCVDCKRRMLLNPLRVLDCKEDKCVQVAFSAPQSVDHLCDDCHKHFKNLLEYLDELNLPYVINHRLVRGLSYYSRTVFEIWTEEEGGKRGSLGGGGRYDYLIESLGGEHTSAVGFGLGIDRIVAEMKRINVRIYREPKPRVFLAQLGELAKKKSLNLFAELEKNGILVAESFGRGSLRSQMRVADSLGVEVALIIGQKESIDETVIVKNMKSGTQETVTRDKVSVAVKKILKSDLIVFKHE